MTKKKPPSGPETPPGRASFPHRLPKASTEIKLTKADRKRLGEKCAAGMAPEEALRELLAEKLPAKLASMKPEVAHQYLQDLGRQPSYAKQAKNLKHVARWFRVHQLRKMSPDSSLDSIFEAVAKDALPVVDPETIRSSYELVERGRRTGQTSQFYFGDDP
jgi:hypothetical protein